MSRWPAASRWRRSRGFCSASVPEYLGSLRLLARLPRRLHLPAYTPRYSPPVGTRPYETSRGNACSCATVPPAHTLMHPGAPSISFAAILPARFSPGFWPTGSPCSATARWFAANPSDPTSRWAPCPAQASSETAALSLLSVSRHSCAQRGVTPAFGYGPRLGRSGWTLTSKDHAPPGAHYQRVRLPRRRPAPSGALPFGKPYSALAKTAEDLPGSRSLVLPPCRAHTPRRGLRRPRPWRPRTLAFQA